MQASEFEQTLLSALATQGHLAQTIQRGPNATIRPDLGTDSRLRRVLERFRRSARSIDASGRKISVGGTLGSGGMGVVRLGRQRSVDREVAVKTLRPEDASNAAALRLLQEGWVTALLEHPNVVPVYDIEVDEAGLPAVVLKRIEGKAWSELLGDAAEVRERFGSSDLLEWNLRILVQVCNAVHFAHSRGILHRDLKPQNVMIGSFGEVYVLDWGIAVSIQGDDEERLPLARDATGAAGTPCYMAPELLGGAPDRLSARTDVYLLCAILHEILTGKPPHGAGTLRDLVRNLLTPPAVQSGPEELAALCMEGLRPEPDERPASAEAVRLRLLDYLTHRGSRRLCQQADERLAELLALLQPDAEPGGPAGERASTPDDGERRIRLYELHSQCRFGFHEALSSWPDNEAASDGLRAATEALARYELRQGDPRAAQNLLASIPAADPALVLQVGRAEQEQQRQRRQLEEVASSLDHRRGGRARTLGAVLLGLSWTAIPLLAWQTGAATSMTHAQNLGLGAFILATVAGLGGPMRGALKRSLYNRRFFWAILWIAVFQIMLGAAAWTLGLEVIVTLVLTMACHALASVLVATAIEPRGWPAAIAYVLAFGAAALSPPLLFLFSAAASATLTVNAAWIWRRGPREDDPRAAGPQQSQDAGGGSGGIGRHGAAPAAGPSTP